MAVYTEELATDIIFPNISVYRQFRDGVHNGYKITANKGYVMYDAAANNMDYDEEGNPFPVTYYYTLVYAPLSANFNNFTWVAVPRDSVPEDMIFGGGNGDHEIM